MASQPPRGAQGDESGGRGVRTTLEQVEGFEQASDRRSPLVVAPAAVVDLAQDQVDRGFKRLSSKRSPGLPSTAGNARARD
jgi:hypothetical protein